MQHKIKYEQHIRLGFRIFDDPQFKSIPQRQRYLCLAVLISLLKYVNNKTGECYPRIHTLHLLLGMSRSTIYRCLSLLKKAGIISKRRLRSTNLYKINPGYIVGVRSRDSNRSERDSVVSARQILIEQSLKKTTINLTIQDCVDKGYDTSKIVSTLATLPVKTLLEGIENKDNIYLTTLAYEKKKESEKGTKKINPEIIRRLAKHTNMFYKSAIEKRKREDARKAKTESFLSSNNKKKY
jgi:Fe2+ or Zn2+ uptake regulation protein